MALAATRLATVAIRWLAPTAARLARGLDRLSAMVGSRVYDLTVQPIPAVLHLLL